MRHWPTEKRGLRPRVPTADEPQPWWQVGLAITPGVMLFAGINLDNLGWEVRVPGFVVLAMLALLAVSSIVWVAVRRHRFGVAAWGLMPLGMLAVVGLVGPTGSLARWRPPFGALLLLAAGYGLLLVAWRVVSGHRSLVDVLPAIGGTLILGLLIPLPNLLYVGWMGWHALSLYATLFLLVAVGAFLTGQEGVAAALFVLSGGILFASWRIELTTLSWDRSAWGTAVDIGLTLLFYVVAPVWVLRSRSILGQAAGLLVPVLAYVALLGSALCAVRGLPVNQSISIASPALVLCAALGAAILLYACSADSGGRARVARGGAGSTDVVESRDACTTRTFGPEDLSP